MYPVSNDYIDKISEQPKDLTRRIRGTVDNVAFTEADVIASSLIYTETCVKSSDINLGGVFVGTLQITFQPSFQGITRGTWHGRTINLSIGLLVDPDNDVWEDIPIKPYVIDEASHSKSGIAIKAYDYMNQFDEAFNISTTAGTIFEMASLACEVCGVTLGQTAAQIAQLPNGTEQFALYPENDIETWRDLVSWLAVTIGGYATINRLGQLEFRTWHDTPDIEMDINDRAVGGSWCDFTTYYTGLSIVDMEKETTRYYNVEPDTGLTMNLGMHPLIQYGTDETRSRQAMAILNSLQSFVYVPFNSSGLLDPCFDLGDVIEYSDGLAGDSSVCCIHKMEFKYSSGMKLTGYGKNPALFGARSKTDKNISGLLSRTAENEMVTHTFLNSSEFDIGSTATDILQIRFATISPRTVKLLHEINFDLDIDSGEDDAQITAYYYLNDDLITFHPISSWDNEGNHILPLMYFLDNLTGGEQYTWRVALKCDRGTIHIDKQGIRALLEAQGLVATEEWDGYLEVSDSFNFTLGGHFTFDYSDSVVVNDDVQHEEWSPLEISENFAFTLGGNFEFNYTDSVEITMAYLFNPWGTDEDDTITTDTGDVLYFKGHYTE